MRAWLALAATLLAGLALAWFASKTPAPRGADAPAQAFSAERAMADVRAIAREPHPTGSAANARVRDHVVNRFRELGLEVRVAPGAARPEKWSGLGDSVRLENIVAVMPGRDRTAPALLIMSHYDSVIGSPGAADDASGVAASLEIARALKARGVPARDVIFLVTDGEEIGLLGAYAFFAPKGGPQQSGPDPLAGRVGMVLNMEARGGGGRAWMFETDEANGELIGLFAKNAVRPSSNSLAIYVYSIMPNGTDFAVNRLADKPGMNFAFIGRPAHYHTAFSTPENLDQGSLQHIGEQVLASARALASADRLPGPAPNAVYSDVLGSFLIAHPAWMGWIGVAVIAALAGFALVRAKRARLFGWRDLGLGAAGALAVLLTAAVLLRLALRLTDSRSGREAYYELLARFPLYETALGLLCLGAALLVLEAMQRGDRRFGLGAAVAAVAAGLACSVQGFDTAGLVLALAAGAVIFLTTLRPAERWGAWGGFLLVGLVLTIGLQLSQPTLAFIAAWPVLAGAAAAAVAALTPRRAAPGLVAAVVLGALALGQIGAWAHGVTLGIGPSLPEALALFGLLGAIAACPVLLDAAASRGARLVAPAVLIAGLALAVWLRLAPPSGMPAPVPYKPPAAEAA